MARVIESNVNLQPLGWAWKAQIYECESINHASSASSYSNRGCAIINNAELVCGFLADICGS